MNGKVERSYGVDKGKFYQLINFIDDFDIRKKLEEWEKFSDCYHPPSTLRGKTPFEALKGKTYFIIYKSLLNLTHHTKIPTLFDKYWE